LTKSKNPVFLSINIKLLKIGGITASKFGAETWTKGQMHEWTNTTFTLGKIVTFGGTENPGVAVMLRFTREDKN
jgi:hypothetical protein